jgi:hypothetical protein
LGGPESNSSTVIAEEEPKERSFLVVSQEAAVETGISDKAAPGLAD